MKIKLSKVANNILDRIYSDRTIFDRSGCFTNWFRLWNDTFHRYVNKNHLDKLTKVEGLLLIGNIGILEYSIRVVRGETCVVITHLYFPTLSLHLLYHLQDKLTLNYHTFKDSNLYYHTIPKY